MLDRRLDGAVWVRREALLSDGDVRAPVCARGRAQLKGEQLRLAQW